MASVSCCSKWSDLLQDHDMSDRKLQNVNLTNLYAIDPFLQSYAWLVHIPNSHLYVSVLVGFFGLGSTRFRNKRCPTKSYHWMWPSNTSTPSRRKPRWTSAGSKAPLPSLSIALKNPQQLWPWSLIEGCLQWVSPSFLQVTRLLPLARLFLELGCRVHRRSSARTPENSNGWLLDMTQWTTASAKAPSFPNLWNTFASLQVHSHP